MAWEKFNYTDDFQEAIIACLIAHPQEFLAYGPMVKPEFFSGVTTTHLVHALEDFQQKYNKWPGNFVILGNYAHDTLLRRNPQEAEEMLKLCKRLAQIDTEDWKAVRDRCLAFAEERAVINAVKKIHFHITEGTIRKIDPMKELQDALTACEANEGLEDAASLIAQDLPTPTELVEGILYQGNKMVLSAGSKSFKTWTLMDLGLSLACGLPWWGCKTKQSTVLYVNFEMEQWAFRKRLQALTQAKAIDKLEEQTFWHACLRGQFDPMESVINRLIQWTRGSDVALVIIDPVYRLLFSAHQGKKSFDENNASDLTMLLSGIERLAKESGAAVVFGHHFSKGNQAAKEHLDRASGSGVFARDPDSILTMTRHMVDGVFTVESSLRNFPPVEPFCVRWKHPIFERAEEHDPADLKQPKRGASKKYADSDWLHPLDDTEALSYTAWRKAVISQTGMSADTFKAGRKRLLDEGKVAQTGDGYTRTISQTVLNRLVTGDKSCKSINNGKDD